MTPANPYRVNKAFEKLGMPVSIRKEYGAGGKYVFTCSGPAIPPIYADNLKHMSIAEIVEYARGYVIGREKVLPVRPKSMPFDPISWKEMPGTGTAYVQGILVWGALLRDMFYCDAAPKGTRSFTLYKRMNWCSPKSASLKRG